MNPTWLETVLASHSHINLDHRDGRALMAEAILNALPRDAMTVSARAAILAKAFAAKNSNVSPEDVASAVVQIIVTLLEAI